MERISIDFDDIDLWDFRALKRRGPADTLERLLFAAQYARRRYYESGGSATFMVKRAQHHDRVIVFRIE